jgi:hypothetical protein
MAKDSHRRLIAFKRSQAAKRTGKYSQPSDMSGKYIFIFSFTT